MCHDFVLPVAECATILCEKTRFWALCLRNTTNIEYVSSSADLVLFLWLKAGARFARTIAYCFSSFWFGRNRFAKHHPTFNGWTSCRTPAARHFSVTGDDCWRQTVIGTISVQYGLDTIHYHYSALQPDIHIVTDCQTRAAWTWSDGTEHVLGSLNTSLYHAESSSAFRRMCAILRDRQSRYFGSATQVSFCSHLWSRSLVCARWYMFALLSSQYVAILFSRQEKSSGIFELTWVHNDYCTPRFHQN